MQTIGQRPSASEDLRRQALACTPGAVHSNVRLDGPGPFISKAEGAWLYDVDGRNYVDYLLGQGPAFLGHAQAQIHEAVTAACRHGMTYGGQHPLELWAAEQVRDTLGWPEMVRFGTTGTEMVQLSLRLARAATGRSKVIRFEGHYHGWLDNVLIAPTRDGWGTASAGQLGSHLDDCIVLPWNDSGRVDDAFDRNGDQIAAVIMEPIMINAGVIEPRPGYLERIRQLCSQHGAVLIFDEMITGFRVESRGAVGRYGVRPDLATYGKAMAGGWPAAALAGRGDLMQRLGTGEVNHAGTFNSSVMATAAVVATMTFLRETPPYSGVIEHGAALMSGIAELGKQAGLPLRVQGLPMAFHVSFGDADVTDYQSLHRRDLARYAELARRLVTHGLWVARRGVWYVSAAHGPSELDAALTRFKQAITENGSV